MFKFAKKATLVALAMVGANVMAGPLDSISGVETTWKLKGFTTEYENGSWGYGAGALKETTWGIGEITQIDDVSSNNLFTGLNGDRLYYMIYGIADLSVIGPNAGKFDIYNIGCVGGNGCDGKIHMDIYRTSSTISNLALQDPHNRSGFGTYTGLTNLPGSSLYLALEMAPGKVTVDDPSTLVDERTATLKQKTDGDVLPTSGDGTFFANAVGGSAFGKWNSNGIDTGISTLVDFDGNFTIKPNIKGGSGGIPGGTGACTAAAVAANTCFAGLINDPVQATALPEPGSLALAGLALFGLAGASRLRRKA